MNRPEWQIFFLLFTALGALASGCYWLGGKLPIEAGFVCVSLGAVLLVLGFMTLMQWTP